MRQTGTMRRASINYEVQLQGEDACRGSCEDCSPSDNDPTYLDSYYYRFWHCTVGGVQYFVKDRELLLDDHTNG